MKKELFRLQGGPLDGHMWGTGTTMTFTLKGQTGRYLNSVWVSHD